MYENWKIKKNEIQEKQEEYSQVAEWCNTTGLYHIDDIDDSYMVVANPQPAPLTHDEVKAIRRQLYIQAKDPITCQIESLKDEQQTDEIIAEIGALKIKRAEIVAEIKQNNPYPEETA